MTLPKIIRTPDGYYRAKIAGLKTAKYGSQVSALRVLCEMLVDQAADVKKARYPWRPTGPCECGGWGVPGTDGCPGCGLSAMGG